MAVVYAKTSQIFFCRLEYALSRLAVDAEESIEVVECVKR